MPAEEEQRREARMEELALIQGMFSDDEVQLLPDTSEVHFRSLSRVGAEEGSC